MKNTTWGNTITKKDKVLVFLLDEVQASAMEIAKGLGDTSQNIYQTLYQMRKANLVMRRAHNQWMLTEDGRHKTGEAIAKIDRNPIEEPKPEKELEWKPVTVPPNNVSQQVPIEKVEIKDEEESVVITQPRNESFTTPDFSWETKYFELLGQYCKLAEIVAGGKVEDRANS